MKSYVKIFIVFISLGFIAGCQKDHSIIEFEEEKPSALIKGRVLASGGFDSLVNSPLVDAAISLKILDENFELENSGKASTSDSEGRFLLKSSVRPDASYFISAEKNSTKMLAFISSDLRNGLTFFSQPLNTETTIEALVYLESLKKNYEKVSYADVSDYINTSVAEAIDSKRELIPSVADMINKKVEARNAFIISGEIGADTDKIAQISAIRKAAKENFERDLYFASNQYLVRNAFNTYIEALINAFISTGISSEKCLKIVEVTHQALQMRGNRIDVQLSFGFNKNSAYIFSRVLQFAVLEKFGELGIQQKNLAVLQSAGRLLESSIQNSKENSEINSAFITYEENVENILRDIIGVRADLLIAFDKAIKEHKVTYESIIISVANIDEMIAAYINFYSQLKNETDLFLQSFNDEQIARGAEVIILLNMHF